jgi:hypothetical protein
MFALVRFSTDLVRFTDVRFLVGDDTVDDIK